MDAEHARHQPDGVFGQTNDGKYIRVVFTKGVQLDTFICKPGKMYCLQCSTCIVDNADSQTGKTRNWREKSLLKLQESK
jgi:hypothetical protein